MGESSDEVVGLFPNHRIVRFDGDNGWGALDANNRLTVVLDGKDALLKLIDSDPPRVTGDLDLAKRYALFVDEIENPDDQRIDTFESVVWKDALTLEEQSQIDAARAKATIEAPVATRYGDNVSVQLWVASEKRLIVRLIKVQPDGHYSYYEIGRADDLPLVVTTAKKFRSLDAFRTYCGAPTMPIERCRLCSKIPGSTSRHVEDDDVSDDRPSEMLELQTFLDGGRDCVILRCPTCHRLYVNETSFGVGYFDYNSYWTRYDVDELFNLEWCVAQRLPNHRVKSVKRGDSPSHVKVHFEDSEGWSVLDTNNRLTLPVAVAPPPPPPAPTQQEREPDRKDEQVGDRLPIVVDVFESLATFRAHCGEPTMTLDQCPICCKVPARCHKGDDDVPREIGQLVDFIGSDVRRCPACHRLYLFEEIVFGNDIYTGNDSTWSLERFSVDALFDHKWCVEQRLPHRAVDSVNKDRFFPKHVLVRFDSGAWGALDGNNQLLMLEGRDALVKLVETDPPRVTTNVDVAMRYAFFVDAFEHPRDERHAARPAMSRLEKPVERRWDQKVIVRFWVTSGERRILRVITVHPDGRYECREGDVPWKIFESLDAFRAHCGEPTMPLEQCPICSKTPGSCDGVGSIDPPETEPLVTFIGDAVRHCPACHRLYFYTSVSGGNDIYLGNETNWSLTRQSPDVLFDSDWGVRQRLPDLDIGWVDDDRFFPNHVLVRFGSRAWGALNHNNQLLVLDSHDAIVKLIDSDPPRVTEDLELAKRYALFIDAREYPEDDRPDFFESIRWTREWSAEEKQRVDGAKAATGLPEATDPVGWHDMRAAAERDGDRIVVRFWVTPPEKRLIRRIVTVLPNGHVIREDSVIAENLPIRDGSPSC